VLDVGCGGGQLALALARRRADFRITGIDLSPDQVARAQRRATGPGTEPAVTFREADALRLPFAENAFECVLSVASLKHWPDERRGLEECRRVLSPDGLLIVVEADRGCRIEDAAAFVASWRIPWFLRPIALPLFRTFVAGQSLDLDDARGLLAALDLREARVERTPDLPGLRMIGRKPRPQTVAGGQP
jgi:ubiquinone/menaquinone biosynthesis C-methylase UbiE